MFSTLLNEGKYMKYQPVNTNQVPAGCTPVSHGTDISEISPFYSAPGVSLAPPSGVEFSPARPLCSHNDYNCKANPVKGYELCIGHLRQYMKKENIKFVNNTEIDTSEAGEEESNDIEIT
jgi:hypothetical protein